MIRLNAHRCILHRSTAMSKWCVVHCLIFFCEVAETLILSSTRYLMWPKFTKLLLGALQVGSTGIPFATWDCSTVPDKPPHVGVGGHWTSVPAICCSTETDRSTVPSEDVWLSGVFGGKSVSLECITRQSERSRADFRHFQASFEDLLLHVILDVSHVQSIKDFLVMCYINVCFTYLLTYSIT